MGTSFMMKAILIKEVRHAGSPKGGPQHGRKKTTILGSGSLPGGSSPRRGGPGGGRNGSMAVEVGPAVPRGGTRLGAGPLSSPPSPARPIPHLGGTAHRAGPKDAHDAAPCPARSAGHPPSVGRTRSHPAAPGGAHQPSADSPWVGEPASAAGHPQGAAGCRPVSPERA